MLSAYILLLIHSTLAQINVDIQLETSSSSLNLTRQRRSIYDQLPKQNRSSWNASSAAEIILHLSENYDLAIHYDNNKSLLADTIFFNNVKAMRAMAALHNYNAPEENFKQRLTRKRSILHVVLLNEPGNFSNSHSRDIVPGDLILFINDGIENNEALGDVAKKLANRVFSLYNLVYSDEQAFVYEMCFYCGQASEKFQLVSKVRTDVPNHVKFLLNEVKKSLIFRVNDFTGYTFNVAFISAQLYFQCKNPKKTLLKNNNVTVSECDETLGVEWEMLKELRKRLNFKVRFVTGPPDPDGAGPWYKSILDVNATIADLAIGGITFTENRAKKVSFSISFGNDPMKVLYALPVDLFGTGKGIILAFHIDTWIMLVATMIILSTVLRISFIYFPYSEKRSCTLGISLAARMLVEQCAHVLNSLSTRSLLISWLMCCVIISTAYKAKISALMINGRSVYPYLLNEMISMDYGAHLNQMDASMMKELLQTSSDPYLQKLSGNTRNDLYFCEAVKSTLYQKSMVIEEQNPLLFDFNNVCFRQLDFDEISRLKLTTDSLFPSGHAWPFRKNAPYLETMNKHIVWLFQSGLYDMWLNTYMKSSGGKLVTAGYSSSGKRFSIREFLGPITIWAIGIALSTVCLLCEVLHKKISKFLDKEPKLYFVYGKQS